MSGMKMLGTPLSRKEDRLAEAANLMLKSGNFQEYCEIHMKLGNFEDAIAYAPKVSMKYWKQCVEKYQVHLTQEVDGSEQTTAERDPVEELANYKILTSQYSEAADILEKAGQTKGAKLVKVMQ